LLAFLISVALFAAPGATGAARPVDLSGNPVQLFGANHSKTIVLVFVRTDCPISNRYAPELRRLYEQFSSRVDFYLVYPDRAESAAAIHKHIADYGYPFGALRDPEHSLVKLAKARVTPEAAVFSPRGQLLYHGRIDDRYVDFGKAMAQPTRRDLEDALRSIVAGRPVAVASTPAIGCYLADVE
jgi:hypothetical protein